MYIKLNFTRDENQKTIWRLFTYIVNDSNITSISQLQSISSSQNWNNDVIGGVDFTTSEIIRTVDPTNTVCHISSHNTYDDFFFTMEQQVYDDPTTKYYLRYETQSPSTGLGEVIMKVSDAVVNDLSTTEQIPVSVTHSDDFRGLDVVPTGSLTTYGLIADDGALGTNLRTFSAYLTDTTLLWYTTSEATPVGFGTTFNNNSKYSGVAIHSQYERYDHHNNAGNGIIPWVYTFPWTSAAFWGNGNHWSQEVNLNRKSDNHNIRFFNIVDAKTRIGNDYPIEYDAMAAHVVGMRSAEFRPIDAGATDTSGVGATYGKIIDSTAHVRHPTSDLNGSGFGLLPFGVSNTLKGNQGGDITSLSNVYIYNGDYYPGDEFALGEKLYTIWPGYTGYTNRFGIAIPKE